MLVFALKTPLQNLMWSRARPDFAMSNFGHSFHCARSEDKIQWWGEGGANKSHVTRERKLSFHLDLKPTVFFDVSTNGFWVYIWQQPAAWLWLRDNVFMFIFLFYCPLWAFSSFLCCIYILQSKQLDIFYNVCRSVKPWNNILCGSGGEYVANMNIYFVCFFSQVQDTNLNMWGYFILV